MQKRKIALYCRVSTKHQGEDDTIQSQINQLRETYKKDNIVKEYEDVITGSEISRPALNQLREDVKEGMFDIIAVYDFSRLSRKLGHQIALIEEFEKVGIKVESLIEGNFEDNPEGTLNRNIRGSFAEYERFKIARRFADGKIRKIKLGRLVNTTAAFGFDRVKDDVGWNYKINPKEAKGIRQLFKIFIDTNSLRKTHEVFYNLGYRSKKTDGTIAKSTIRAMLSNELYIGNWHYGDYQVKVPSIINKAIFNKAQEMLDKDKSQYIKPSKFFALCRGLIKCIHCHKTYGYTTLTNGHRKSGKPFAYRGYACRQGRHHIDKTKPRCRTRSISGSKLDGYVWEYVSSLIKDSAKIKKAIKLLQEKRENEKGFNQKVYDSLIIEKGNLTQKKQKLLGLYTDDNITKADLDSAISDINSQVDNLGKQILEAEKELTKINNLAQVEEEVERLCLEYKKRIDNLTPEQKIYVVRKWVKEINILDNGDIKIKVKIPITSKVKEKVKVDDKIDVPIFNPALVPNASYVRQNSPLRPSGLV